MFSGLLWPGRDSPIRPAHGYWLYFLFFPLPLLFFTDCFFFFYFFRYFIFSTFTLWVPVLVSRTVSVRDGILSWVHLQWVFGPRAPQKIMTTETLHKWPFSYFYFLYLEEKKLPGKPIILLLFGQTQVEINGCANLAARVEGEIYSIIILFRGFIFFPLLCRPLIYGDSTGFRVVFPGKINMV